MRKILPFILIAGLLAGCGIIGQAVPTESDADMATRVAQILTTMPTATSPVTVLSPTAALPTVEPKAPETATMSAPTEAPPTQAPTEAASPSETPQPTQSTAPTQTPTTAFTPPSSDPVNKLGTAGWTDNLDDDNNWPTGSDKFTTVSFGSGVMRMTGLTTTDGWRLTWPNLTNFYLEMTFQTGDCKGEDRYGMIARVPDGLNPDRGYLFGLTCDGKYSLRRWNASVGAKGEMVNLVKWTASPAVNSGSNQTNRIGLMAVGDRLILYVNGQLMTEVKDNTFAKGYFGVFVGARETDSFTARLDQVRYWENPTP